jgi:hypothetical protein
LVLNIKEIQGHVLTRKCLNCLRKWLILLYIYICSYLFQ